MNRCETGRRWANFLTLNQETQLRRALKKEPIGLHIDEVLPLLDKDLLELVRKKAVVANDVSNEKAREWFEPMPLQVILNYQRGLK